MRSVVVLVCDLVRYYGDSMLFVKMQQLVIYVVGSSGVMG